MSCIWRFFLISLLAAAGCKEISFPEPQPRGRKPLPKVPATLQGEYLVLREDGELSKDTVVIMASGYRFGYFEPLSIPDGTRNDSAFLSDSLVLKSYKGYYFVNLREPPQWKLRVLKQEKNGDILYMTPEQDGVEFRDYLRKISREIRVDSVRAGEKMFYYIDPSPRQLVDLVEKGYFTSTALRKIR